MLPYQFFEMLSMFFTYVSPTWDSSHPLPESIMDFHWKIIRETPRYVQGIAMGRGWHSNGCRHRNTLCKWLLPFAISAIRGSDGNRQFSMRNLLTGNTWCIVAPVIACHHPCSLSCSYATGPSPIHSWSQLTNRRCSLLLLSAHPSALSIICGNPRLKSTIDLILLLTWMA